MRFCDNVNCDLPDEPLERISDYRIIDGAVICVGCDEAEREEAEWRDANLPGMVEDLVKAEISRIAGKRS